MKNFLYVFVLVLSGYLFGCLSGYAQDTPKEKLDSALMLMKENNYKQAKTLLLDAVSQYEKNNDSGADYASCLHQLAICLSGDDVTLAMQYGKQAMELRRKIFGILNEDYITSYNNVGIYYRIMKQYDEAIRIHKEVLELSLKLKPVHKNIAMYAQNIGLDYELAGDEEQALAAYENALNYYERFSEPYGKLLEKIAMGYYELNNEQKFVYYMELIDEHNKKELEKECNEPKCMMERAEYYASINNLTDAKKCYLEAILLCKTPEEKMVAQGGYALFLFKNRNYAEAKDYFRQLCMDYEQHKIKDEIYVDIVRNLALSYYFLRDYDSAINEFQGYRTLYKDLGLENQGLYYTSLSVMASSYYLKKDYTRALEVYGEIKDYYSIDKNSEGYADAIRHMANVHVRLENYNDAVSLFEEAIDIYERLGKDAKLNQAMSDLNICCIKGGIIYDDTVAKQHRNKMIRKLLDENIDNLDIYKRVFGEDDLVYAQTLGNIAEQYRILGEDDKAIEYYSKFVPAQRVAIKNTFRTLGSAERNLIWKEYSEPIDSLMSMAVSLAANDVMSGLAYDIQLLSKGILLNSSVEFENVLHDTGDAELLSVYRHIKANYERINDIMEYGNNLDSLLILKQSNDMLETTLLERCAEYKDYTDYLLYTWKDVQKKLNPSDVAIEFAEVRNGLLDGDNMLVAILITDNCDAPTIIEICTREQLKEMLVLSDVYDNTANGDLFWKNILPYLKNKERVFFSADVELHSLAVEYLSVSGKPMFERYDMYRLSSTKELCKTDKTAKKKNIALFGGIDYTREQTLSEKNSEAVKSLLSLTRDSLKRSYNGVFDFSLLPYSLDEVSIISKMLSERKDFNIVEYAVGTNAGKNNFLGLESKNVNVLHLSTHGVYQTPEKGSKSDPMDNCFLIFAGANSLSVNPDDAMVTADEIAQMNLRECELAVLSTCESGLGKLDKDGVFGLQRGFKNAGVDALIMSLKSVYDKQSSEMMIMFYKNWIKERSIHRAFVKTLQELRGLGWSGKHWANFILLDSLD